MSDQVYLGVDLGAESGRVMAGHWDGSRIRLEELHRFPNLLVNVAGTLRWDVMGLWDNIQKGLRVAAQKYGAAVKSVGVDTWAVDYVLLSATGEILGQPFNYRDERTVGGIEAACAVVPREEIFAQSGVQFIELNTLYQLIALKRQSPELLEAADTFLMMPDWLNWCLSGSKVVEFTNATTTQFFHPTRRKWSDELLTKFGLPRRIFPEVVPPGTNVGTLRETVQRVTGLGAIDVIAPATHDTGSAVAAVPTTRTGTNNWAYISSGTWCLMGAEVPEAKLGASVLARNFTNEGGVDGTYRLLKNIMGLWLVQQIKKTLDARGSTLGYADLVAQAAEAEPLRSLVDPDDARFFRPGDMPQMLQDFCRETDQPVPQTPGELVRCALESLALKYRLVLDWLEEINGERIEVIHVVGGGCRSDLLNQFTADACERTVWAGPIEATVLGNLMVQLRAAGEVRTLDDIRRVVRESFDHEMKRCEPEPAGVERWREARGRFLSIMQKLGRL